MMGSSSSQVPVPPASAELGRYRLIARLAHGGMGDVYLALHQGPGGFHKLAVVKELRPSFLDEPGFLRMFMDEARLAARLHHPNVVQTNEVGSEGGRHFIVMEYLEGQPLQRILGKLGRDGSFPVAMQIRVIADALRGLHYAHELREFDGSHLAVVHRDFTPHNVFVTYDGQIKVVDFGIAKAVDTQDTRTGVVKGKAAYMAPEQALGKKVDRRADVFSAGVMLWEAATGQRLWSGLTEVQILMKVVQEAVPSPRYVNPYVPAELARICVRALAKDPEERYATADEMRLELEAFLDASGLVVTATEVGALVAQAFSDERAKIHKLVDANLKLLRSQAPTVPAVPALSRSELGVSGVGHLGASSVGASAVGTSSVGGSPLGSTGTFGAASLGASGAAGAGTGVFGTGTFARSGRRPAVPDAATDVRSITGTGSGTPGMTRSLTTSAPFARPLRGVGYGVGIGFLAACALGAGLYAILGRGATVDAPANAEPARVAAPVVAVPAPSPERAVGIAAVTPSADAPAPLAAPATGAPGGSDGARAGEATTGREGSSKERSSRSRRSREREEEAARVFGVPVDAPGASTSGSSSLGAVAPVAEPRPAPPSNAAPPSAAQPSAAMPFQGTMTRPVLLSGQDPVYTREARLARVEGTMIVKCTITTAGTLESCRVIKPVPLMEQPVLEALRTRRYTPVLYEGRPVAVDYVFNVQLVLPK